MPQTLVLSDIHGNHPALTAVLADAYRRYRPDEVWCLGDMVGYGPFPLLVWQALKAQPIPDGGWLAGNHEMGLLGSARGPIMRDGFTITNYRLPAWNVLQMQKKVLDGREEVLAHLRSLPVMSSPRPGVYLTHGAFIEDARLSVHLQTEQPPPPDEITARFLKAAKEYPDLVRLPDKDSPARIFAFGHTHKPGLWRWGSGRKNKEWTRLDHTRTYHFDDLEKNPLAFNPGSAGFPRNENRCPSYVLIDWEAHRISLRYVKYDVELTRAAMRESPYKELLAEPGFLVDPVC